MKKLWRIDRGDGIGCCYKKQQSNGKLRLFSELSRSEAKPFISYNNDDDGVALRLCTVNCVNIISRFR